MRRTRLACALVTVLALSCSSSGGGSPDAAQSDGGQDGDQDAPPAATLSCLMIRNCIVLCESDPPCIQSCIDRGSPAGRAVFDQVVACSLEACPTGNIDCRCEIECYAGGACIDLVDECTQSLQENFCLLCV
jgi:hypothetical protein